MILNRPADALASLDRALAVRPDDVMALVNRGNTLVALSRYEEAIVTYRRALENGGAAEEIKYRLAALGAETSPAIAPKQFVANMFDQYADNFEQHLVGVLKYQSPSVLFDAIARIVPSRKLDILDLGCGTGLLGVLLRPLARTLTGIDLSPNMLKKAQQHQVYDELICGELNEFLQTQVDNFDLAVTTDVFIYIGDLAKVFHGVRGALRDGGLFGFSVEANQGEDYVLRPTLRYAHSMAYLQKLAGDYGFSLESNELKVIRQEQGVDVDGYHVIMRRL
jgi:predicted TPR repeat methyltransferase